MPEVEVKKGRTAFEDYQVSPDRPVRLDVTVGYGQPGGISVKLGSKTVASGANIRAVPLGKGRELAGKTLSIVAAAGRGNPSTRKVGVRVDLQGGAFDWSFELQDDASEDEDIQFVVRVDFFQ